MCTYRGVDIQEVRMCGTDGRRDFFTCDGEKQVFIIGCSICLVSGEFVALQR